MKKDDLEKMATAIVAGAQPVYVPAGNNNPASLKLSEHYPRFVRENLRMFCLAFIEEAAKNVLSAKSPAEAAQLVRSTLTWE